MALKKLGIARIIVESDIIKVQNSLNVDRDLAIEYLEKTGKEWITRSICLAIEENNLINFERFENKISGYIEINVNDNE